MDTKVLKPEDVNKMIVLLDEITSLLEQNEAEAYCPTCEEYLGEDQDLALNLIEKCPRCGQRFTEE